MISHHDDNGEQRQPTASPAARGNHLQKQAVIVIIPGAWHHPVHYDGLAEPLRQQGFKVQVAALTTMGEPDTVREKTHHDDVDAVRGIVQPHLDAGREVVIVAHSYGGLVATDVTAGSTVEERRENVSDVDGLQVGGVKAVVYIASPAVVEKGLSLVEGLDQMRMGDDPGSEGKVTIEDGLVVTTEEAWKFLYSGANEKLARDAFAVTSRHHSLASFLSESAAGARDLRTRLAYVVAGADKYTVSPEVQHRIADGMGPRCKKHVLEDAGHAPWMQPELLPKLLGVITEVVMG